MNPRRSPLSEAASGERGTSPRRPARLGVTAWLALVATFGCGKVGPPVPPQPRGPFPPTAVAMSQVGSEARFRFNVSRPRGDKTSQLPASVELIRIVFGPGIDPFLDPDVFRRRGTVVAQIEEEPLEQRRYALVDRFPRAPDGSVYRYALRVRDRRGRGSPLVALPELEPLPDVAAPTPVGTAVPDGIRLTWSADAAGDAERVLHVYRREGPTEPAVLVGSAGLAEGAFVDTDVVVGRRYAYGLRVRLAEGEPVREGTEGAPVAVVAEDRFAPETPRGLVAVQEGAGIRLFWNPNRENDLAGYRVQRSVDGGPFERVGAPLLDQPSYRDDDVEIDQVIEYRVLAVDGAAPPNVSAPTEAVRVRVVAEPLSRSPLNDSAADRAP